MTYSLKDIKELIFTYIDQFKPSKKDAEIHIKTWIDAFKDLKRDFIIKGSKKINTRGIIIDLLGPYWSGASKGDLNKRGLIAMVFTAPLKRMPLYIESEDFLEKTISRWRLKIGR
jgi:hypothetical protein